MGRIATVNTNSAINIANLRPKAACSLTISLRQVSDFVRQTAQQFLTGNVSPEKLSIELPRKIKIFFSLPMLNSWSKEPSDFSVQLTLPEGKFVLERGNDYLSLTNGQGKNRTFSWNERGWFEEEIPAHKKEWEKNAKLIDDFMNEIASAIQTNISIIPRELTILNPKTGKRRISLPATHQGSLYLGEATDRREVRLPLVVGEVKIKRSENWISITDRKQSWLFEWMLGIGFVEKIG